MEKKFYHNMKLVAQGEPPKCTVCGEEIGYEERRKNYFLLTTCTNKNCICYNNKSNKIRTLSIFGKESVEEMEQRKKESSNLCEEYWLKRGYSKEEANERIKKIQSANSKMVKNRGNCSRKTIEKQMEAEDADLFFRKKSRYCAEYWTSRGYTEEQAKDEISKLQSANGKAAKAKFKRENNCKCVEYWYKVSGLTMEEATKVISESQKSFSLEKCIEKYGEAEGLKRWKERQEKWQKSLHESENLHVGYSKISQTLFNSILEEYGDGKDYVFYGSKNHEYCIRDNGQNYIYDFTDLSKRKIIEFQGDIYHANPILFESDDRPNPFKRDKRSKDLWEFDTKKRDVALKNGFSFLAVWEKEYRENKEEVFKRCLKFLELC